VIHRDISSRRRRPIHDANVGTRVYGPAALLPTRSESAYRASDTTSQSAAPAGTFERTDHVAVVQTGPNIAKQRSEPCR
jgi:hypothetical protein